MNSNDQILQELVDAVNSPDWWAISITVVNALIMVWLGVKQYKLQQQQKKVQEYEVYRMLYAMIKESDWCIGSYLLNVYRIIAWSKTKENITDELEDMQKRIYQMERRLMQHIIDFELKLPNGETIVREYQRALLQAANICGFIVRVSTKDIELQETGIEQTYSQSMILENEIITKSVIVSRIKDDESANLLEKHLNTLVRYKDKLNENKYINTIAERCKNV